MTNLAGSTLPERITQTHSTEPLAAAAHRLAQVDAGSWLARHRAPGRFIRDLVQIGHIAESASCLHTTYAIEGDALRAVLRQLLQTHSDAAGLGHHRGRQALFRTIYQKLLALPLLISPGPAQALPPVGVVAGFAVLRDQCGVSRRRAVLALMQALRSASMGPPPQHGTTEWEYELHRLIDNGPVASDPRAIRKAMWGMAMTDAAAGESVSVLGNLIRTATPGAALAAGVQGFVEACGSADLRADAVERQIRSLLPLEGRITDRLERRHLRERLAAVARGIAAADISAGSQLNKPALNDLARDLGWQEPRPLPTARPDRMAALAARSARQLKLDENSRGLEVSIPGALGGPSLPPPPESWPLIFS